MPDRNHPEVAAQLAPMKEPNNQALRAGLEQARDDINSLPFINREGKLVRARRDAIARIDAALAAAIPPDQDENAEGRAREVQCLECGVGGSGHEATCSRATVLTLGQRVPTTRTDRHAEGRQPVPCAVCDGSRVVSYGGHDTGCDACCPYTSAASELPDAATNAPAHLLAQDIFNHRISRHDAALAATAIPPDRHAEGRLAGLEEAAKAADAANDGLTTTHTKIATTIRAIAKAGQS